jgi:hypothetical protein
MESALPRWCLAAMVFLSPGDAREDASAENGGLRFTVTHAALTDSGRPVCEPAVMAHVSVGIQQVFVLWLAAFHRGRCSAAFPFRSRLQRGVQHSSLTSDCSAPLAVNHSNRRVSARQ